MKGKDIAIIILSIVVVIQFIVILFLLPLKAIEEVNDEVNVNSQWSNLQTYND